MITSEAAHRDFRLCAEALIDRPIVTATDDRPLLDRIRRHQPALQSTFGRLTGWRVQAHPEFARLVKTPARAEASHGLAWARGRTDYALLTWVLWYGEHTGGRRFTVSQIAEEIKLRSTGPGDPGLDWASRDQRLAARRVFRGLEELGVLRLQDGSVDEWADENGKRDALYSWGDAAWRLHVGIPASELERLAEGRPSSPSPAPPEGTDELRLYRTLLLNPALFRRDDPAAFRLLDAKESLARVIHNLKYLTNWELEVTPEYARVLRPPRSDDAVQTPIAVTSGLAHAVLCFCGLLRERQQAGRLVSAGSETFLIDESRIWQDLDELQKRFGAKWGKTMQQQKVSALADDVVAEMKAWGLMRDTDVPGQYLVLPTAGRLAAHYAGEAVSDDDAEDR
ncbi:TIGR02678 family protein [Longimicrobium sp.]|uniref:TIGR02678 family protein n=1 Tax=Longimicrobium sp. TaxID=2029185 RepID=UPI002F93A5E6